ncbi:MAG: CoA transferase, partial [Chloroflexi bacterium]|nr:CoA transferase [Chloroflexota bacterium]
AAGVGAGVVQSGADLAQDPQLEERGFFRRVLDSHGTTRTIEGPPYKLSLTPGGPRRGAPEFGADQTRVLRDVLGMPDEELAECAIAGVFE